MAISMPAMPTAYHLPKQVPKLGMKQRSYRAARRQVILETAVACQRYGQILWRGGFPTAARFT